MGKWKRAMANLIGYEDQWPLLEGTRLALESAVLVHGHGAPLRVHDFPLREPVLHDTFLQSSEFSAVSYEDLKSRRMVCCFFLSIMVVAQDVRMSTEFAGHLAKNTFF